MARKWTRASARPERHPGTGPWSWIAVVAGLAVGAGGLVALVLILRPETDAPFRPHVPGYLALAGQATTPLPPGPVAGRMLVLNTESQKVDKLHFLLPHTLRARKPEEVAYVVLVRYRREQDGVYRLLRQGQPTGAEVPAWRWDCDVRVVEAATRRAASTTIRGPDPRDVIRERGDQSTEGSVPTLLVREYLIGLAPARR